MTGLSRYLTTGAMALGIAGLPIAPGNSTGSAGVADPLDAVLVEGEQLFLANCSGCHGPAGEGGAGPALAGNEKLA